MRVLLFGAKGWIASMFAEYLSRKHQVIPATSRADDYYSTFNEILSVNPDCVVSLLGRTYGYIDDKLIPNIDYLEAPGKLVENMRDNFIAPINLAQICEKLDKQFVYIGTGCIFTYKDDKKIFYEEDLPNFFGSSYSIVKGYTDKEIRKYKTSLNLRIRMPISYSQNSRNFINKIVGYNKICSIPNSMTVLDDMFPIIERMIETGEVGTYNLVNPGLIEHNWILDKFRDIINPDHKWESVSYEEQRKTLIKADRSNNELTTHKLELFCKENNLDLPRIQDSVQNILFSWA